MLKHLLLVGSLGMIHIGFGQLMTEVEFASSENTKKIELLKRYEGSLPVITSVPVPTKLYFAGERVPLEKFDVREKLELELLSNAYRHSRTLLILKKLGRWEKQIKAILKENDIPEDFFYLAIAESELENTVNLTHQ